MGTSYVQLTVPERMGLTLLLVEGPSQRAAAARPGREAGSKAYKVADLRWRQGDLFDERE